MDRLDRHPPYEYLDGPPTGMPDLSDDPALNEAYERLNDLIEHLERKDDPESFCVPLSVETGLSPYDLTRILRWRRKWPHWREQKIIPIFIIQKAMALEGLLGPQAQAFWQANDWTRNRAG
ncbi:hypothetical protein ACLBKU_17605 [Erythrobacter sp. NE805]|uniref:hypothetical protein n=1 Tax=Erythrobacter sp. NE805 TaxID=3389875 RepID=UPI00396AF4AF